MVLCGGKKRKVNNEEISSINSLKRGVYSKINIKKGEKIRNEDIFFAMPYINGQVESGKWKDGIVSKIDIKPNEPILTDKVSMPEDNDYIIIKKAIHEVKAMLSEAKIFLNSEFEVEYSHHYGIKNFRENGVIIINVINREYCKNISSTSKSKSPITSP